MVALFAVACSESSDRSGSGPETGVRANAQAASPTVVDSTSSEPASNRSSRPDPVALAIDRILADSAARALGPSDLRWPSIELQLPEPVPESVRDLIPECDGPALISSAGIGPVRVGESLADLFGRCRAVWPFYQWAEGVPLPAVAVRVSGALLRIEVSDTTREALVRRVLTYDEVAATADGIGPGRTLAVLTATQGSLRFGSAECAVYAWSNSLPGVSWVLEFPSAWDCLMAESVNETGGPIPPRDTKLAMAIVVHQTGGGA